tara:strand:+ start:371 stop:961 length:591 start_codon:yes stop_codon:yes gene_type:complete
MDNLVHPFPCPIYQNFIEEKYFSLIKKNIIQYIKDNKDEFKPSWLCPTLSSFFSPNSEDIFEIPSLIPQIYFHVEKYIKYWKNFEKNPTSFTCENIWINVAETGAYQEEHHHDNLFLSGTIYFQVNPKSGSFQFINPLSAQSTLFLSPEKFGYTYNIEPQNSMILIFPSWMHHRVLSNQSTENRISVSFNIKANFN